MGVDMAERTAITAVRDEDLVERAARGDVDAFEVLVSTRLTRSFRTASAILGNEADANDVVQEAFVVAWRRLPTLRDSATFDGWLNKVIVNRCRDVLRRRQRTLEIELTDAVDVESRDPLFESGAMAELNAAFESLSADRRYLLVMHHLHQVPVASLARQLGVPEGTMKWRLHAARAALQRKLEADR